MQDLAAGLFKPSLLLSLGFWFGLMRLVLSWDLAKQSSFCLKLNGSLERIGSFAYLFLCVSVFPIQVFSKAVHLCFTCCPPLHIPVDLNPMLSAFTVFKTLKGISSFLETQIQLDTSLHWKASVDPDSIVSWLLKCCCYNTCGGNPPRPCEL